MRKFSVVAVSLIFSACGSGDRGPKIAGDAFVAEVSRWEAVKDVGVSGDNRSIWVGVLDNGQSRDGYAMTVCETAREHALKPGDTVYVKIVDVAKAAQNETVFLGEHRCEL